MAAVTQKLPKYGGESLPFVTLQAHLIPLKTFDKHIARLFGATYVCPVACGCIRVVEGANSALPMCSLVWAVTKHRVYGMFTFVYTVTIKIIDHSLRGWKFPQSILR